ncbi:hypothetical protein [Rhizobium sp. SG2393]|uniref:hypothetical protein n=1 Tax=Rhizobium sp. SG2393 TaxID=3276279 RepID=UPI003672A9EE
MRHADTQAFHDISLVCRAGYDIGTLTPLLCRLVRIYIGAAAVGIFWMDGSGKPVGFHHEDSPVGARELFANEFDRLFCGPDEMNVAFLSNMKSRQRLGVLLAPPESYYRSNTFNLLVRPSGHHHTLDLRVDLAGRTRIVVLAFRERGNPFTAQDAVRLQRIEPALRAALAEPHEENWLRQGDSGHLIVDRDGRTVRFLDPRGDALLRECSLVGQDIRLEGAIVSAPRFIEDMCHAESAGLKIPTRTLAIPSGQLELKLQRLTAPASDDVSAFIISLEKQVPMSLSALNLVLGVKLSPTQKLLVISAARGTNRSAAADALMLSNEAVKKHLATVYSTLGICGWEEIPNLLARSVV